MKTNTKILILVLVLLAPLAIANAAVNLSFSVPTMNITSGGTFSLTLSLNATAGETVTAIDYYLQELSAAGFSIIGRNTSGSPFSSTYFTDTQVTSTGDAQSPAGADNALNPRNDYDLGGTTNPVGTTVTGTQSVATFQIQAPSGLTPGSTFTVTTNSNAGTGWVGAGPSFTDHQFDNQASILLTVVPEPATWSLLGLCALGAFGVNLLRVRVRARR